MSLIKVSVSIRPEQATAFIFPEKEGYIYQIDASYLGEQYAMSAKESRQLLKIVFSEGSELPADMSVFFKHVHVRIVYKSIYEEAFTLDSSETKNPHLETLNSQSITKTEKLFDNFISTEIIDMQFKYIGYVLLAAGLASGGYLIANYSDRLWAFCPSCVKALAVVVILYAITLGLVAAFLPFQKYFKEKSFSNFIYLRRLFVTVLMGLISLVAVYIVMAAFYAATDSNNCSYITQISINETTDLSQD